MKKMPLQSVGRDATDVLAEKLDSTFQHMTKMKEMILQGERPKDIAAELNIPVQMVNAVLRSSDIDKREILSLRQFRAKRAVYLPKLGAHKFHFWVVLPREITSYRVSDITDTQIVITLNPKKG